MFCSAWDRANHTYCGNSTGWGCGACAAAGHGEGEGCYVGSWSTEDLRVWDGPRKALTLPLNQTVPNVAASMVPAAAQRSLPANLPKHQAFMALENGDFPIAVNTGTGRDLSTGWELVEHGHGANSPGVACPAAR